MNEYLDIRPEVREALEAGKPVVALESTILRAYGCSRRAASAAYTGTAR